MPLSNNWRFTTSRYISKRDGSDADTGGQSDPYETIGKHLEQNVATGSIRNGGVYNEGGFDVTVAGIYNNKGMTLFGDGFVVVDGSSFFPFFRSTTGFVGEFIMNNITFMNCNEISNGTSVGRSNKFTKCRFFDSINIDLNDESNETLFARTSVNQRFGVPVTYFRLTFIDSALSILGAGSGSKINVDGHTWLNCAFDDGSSINNGGGIVSYTIANCAFEDNNAGLGFQIDATNITNITLDGDGNTIGNLYSDGQKFSGILTIGSETINFTNCFWTADMGFNAHAKDVFTLNNSPQSILLNNNNIIGAFPLGLFIDSKNQCFDPLNSGVNIDSNITRNLVTGNFDINNSPGGIVTSTDNPAFAITLPFSTSISEFVEWSLQGFNFFNGEWVDRANYNDPTNLEVRLTYRVQVYDEIGMLWGSWIEYEINQPLEKDGSNRGNGNVDATMTALGDVIGRIFRVEFDLRDDGV